MLISINTTKGIDIKRSVNISPVGVIIAAMIKIPIIISARCLVNVETLKIFNFIKKNRIRGSWNKNPLPRIHQNMNSRILLIFIIGLRFSVPKEKKNFKPTGINIKYAKAQPIKNNIIPENRNGRETCCSLFVRPGPMNAHI